ncbi:MAG: 50S ribosomal protein L30 [Deltaproteobacteria bacterium]|nr:50S ribosomal protein L30 [Deltaproteobacteria bacterium]
MADKIKIKQIKSGIGKPKPQKDTLLGLGFKKLNQVRMVEDTPCIRGMIRKISHLVKVIDNE